VGAILLRPQVTEHQVSISKAAIAAVGSGVESLHFRKTDLIGVWRPNCGHTTS
jgi:hypothetical protein